MDHTHINPAFDEALKRMDALLEEMEDTVLSQITDTQLAFDEMSIDRARAVRKKDKVLNRLAIDVEEQVVSVLAKYQPVAEDLRHTIGALKMSIEYERSGDYVKHLAKSISRLAGHDETLAVAPALRELLEAVRLMFADFVAAKRAGDIRAEMRVWLRDQKIDDLCSEAVRQCYENLSRGDGTVHSFAHAVSVAKNSERVGDKVKNLVEIYYRQRTGEEFKSDDD